MILDSISQLVLVKITFKVKSLMDRASTFQRVNSERSFHVDISTSSREE